MKILVCTLFFFITLFANDFKTLPLKTAHHEATLIYKTVPNASKAVLYIHGFNDYFFNEEFAQKFIENGYSFFAIDLHHYGRNITPHSMPYYFKDVREFDDEITLAIDHIKNDFAVSNLTLYGYSQGSLIASLYAATHKHIDQLIVDSAFFDFNFHPWIEKIVLPVVAYFGQFFPEFKIDSNSPNTFGQSLHKDFYGEWDFDLNLKHIKTNAPIYLGWIHAIYEAQKKVHQGINVNIPVLNIYSTTSHIESLKAEFLFSSDIVLDVQEIAFYGKKLNQTPHLTTSIAIENAMHGVTLSTPSVREKAYDEIFRWLNITN